MRSPTSKRLEKGPKSIRNTINAVRQDALTAQPVAGDGIKVSEHEGKGTMVSVDRSNLGRAASGVVVTVEDASGYAPGAGVSFVSNVDTVTFDSNLFEIYDGGGGQVVVKLKTTTCGA